jgi:hypothetical protein
MNIDETIASAITQREEEVAGYQFNITNFEMMLARLPADWDAESIAARDRDQITESERASSNADRATSSRCAPR